jgi:hypothetical protein
VLHVDTRPSPADELRATLRTWPGGADHAEMRARYVSANPPPPAREYRTVTAVATAWQASCLGWTYECVRPRAPPPGRHASWVKIRHVLDAWDELAAAWDAVVVLDTDAWIRDGEGFGHLVRSMLDDPGTLYLASGEPTNREVAHHQADAMNGGFMCFRPAPAVKAFLQAAWALADAQPAAQYATEWPWEQACLCRAHAADAAGCRAWMRVLPATQCNTPAGTLVAHCWYKDLAHDLCVDDLLRGLGRRALGLPSSGVEFVVARHGEDVSWLDAWLPFVDRVTVYDKSDDPMTSPHPKLAVVPLPNVGREAHTYARHMATRHGDLCATVVFTQGKYEDHLSHAEFDAMVRGRGRSDAAMDVPWHQSVMEAMGWTPARNWAADPMQPAGMTVGKYFLTYVGDDLVALDRVRYWPGAIFAVSADAVRRHPAAKYAAIADTLTSGSNPEAAHVMERFWKVMFE